MPRMGGNSDANKSQLDYIIRTGLNNSTYGDDSTPRLRPQIVGGLLTMVADDKKPTPRPEPPVEVKFRPAPRGVDFNPDKINTYPMTLYGYQEKQEPLTEPLSRRDVQAYESRAAFSPHRVIPPIDSPSKESFELPPKKLRLQDHLINGHRKLPPRQIVLSRDEVLELKSKLQEELKYTTQTVLKSVYLEMVDHDNQLTDMISYDKMWEQLTQFQVPISPAIFTLVAAQFMDEFTGKINYSKVLSFISGALAELNRPPPQRTREPVRESPRRPTVNVAPSPQGGQYFNPVTHQTEETGGPGSKFPKRDHEMAKLLRYMEQQLSNAENMMDIEDIWKEFAQADKERRSKFSEEQIAYLNFKCNIPLQGMLMKKILERCEKSNDQYNWRQYLELIERVCPLRTGYNLPESKKPTEYVKTMPKPSSNWPNPVEPAREPDYHTSQPDYHTTQPDYHTTQPDYHTTQPQNYVHHPQQQHVNDYDRSQSKQSHSEMSESRYQPDYHTPQFDYHTSPPQNYMRQQPQHIHDYDRSQSKQSQVDMLESKIHSLENKYKRDMGRLMEQKKQATGEEKWFDRFKILADAMYHEDKSYKGTLARGTAEGLIYEHNDRYNLNIPNDKIQRSLRDCTNDGGQVILDSLLRLLGVRGP